MSGRESMLLTVIVEILNEVGLTRETASELVGVHVGEGALLRCDSLWINHL